ncbi:hypothetical protein MYCTH_2111340 [Thermothelomyces thermophilus ATCC 42464]|uniref:Uncharacterized protein n=1 Tax=Thermothelomyces thermophilus (strain ATCC 42464 / BCRC 31852 / DSM 1799) TaxID=573729 RepID=G2QF79_THET4|nr:uncharacterized protein MYCTH_2111340 [Thermothelomyces thermophilus ATCC 42464]AEO59108.1 hypothetical protein MYCTH_2111340 [Thermothelomyces thermophilus ATCC 42464]
MSSSDNINTTRLHVLAAVASQEEHLPAHERLHYDCLLILAEAANRALAGLISSEEGSEKEEEEEIDGGTWEENPPGARTTESDYDGGGSTSEAEDTIIAWAKTSTSVSRRDRRRSPPNLRRENKNMATRRRRRRLEQQRRGRQARGGGDDCPRRDDDGHRVADGASRALCQVVRRDGLGGASLRYQRQAAIAFSAVGDRTGLILTMTDAGHVRIEFTHARTEDK